MKLFTRLLLIGGLSAVATHGWAATATTTFTVTGTVVAACSVTAGGMSFGTTIPNPITANIDATSTITATCANGTPYTIALSAGGGPGATFATRFMTNGGSTMTYSLYTNAARTAVWGTGAAGSTVAAGTGNGAAQPITVWGRIPPQTVATAGAYTDTITVTITF